MHPTAGPSFLERRFLDTRAAAAYLGLSPRTMEKLRWSRGGPPFRKHLARVVYDVASLDAWSEAQACTSINNPDPEVAENQK